MLWDWPAGPRVRAGLPAQGEMALPPQWLVLNLENATHIAITQVLPLVILIELVWGGL